MKRTRKNECFELTKNLITSYYQGNIEQLIQYLHKNCVWIGSLANDFYHGIDAICKMINENNANMPLIHLNLLEFYGISLDLHSYIVVGKYIGVTDKSTNEIFRDMQRVTFVWKEEKGQLKINHIHLSDPMSCVVENENFPHQLSIYTNEYLETLIKKEVYRSECIFVKDKMNIHHKISLSDIIYLEAFNVNTMIHTTDTNICARISISKVVESINKIQKNMIVRNHKSYAVNKYYVKSIKRYELSLVTKEKLPMSKQSYALVKDQLHKS